MSKPKTVKVRVAVAVDQHGKWAATGYESMQDKDGFDFIVDDLATGEARYFITAELEIPEPREVAAEVEKHEA